MLPLIETLKSNVIKLLSDILVKLQFRFDTFKRHSSKTVKGLSIAEKLKTGHFIFRLRTVKAALKLPSAAFFAVNSSTHQEHRWPPALNLLQN